MLTFSQLIRISPTNPEARLQPINHGQLDILKPVLINLLQFLALFYILGGYQVAFSLLNELGSYLPDRFWATLTLLADTRVALLIMLLFVFNHPRLLSKIVIAGFFTTLIVQGTKFELRFERPPAVLPADSYHLIGDFLTMNSFPSGHSATIAVAATLLLTLVHNRKLAQWLVVSMFVIAFSRVMVAAHWPVDVLCGILVGCLCSAAAHWLVEHHLPHLWPPLQWLVTGIIVIGALSLFVDDGGYPQGQLFAILLTLAVLIRYAWQLNESLPKQYRQLTTEHSNASS